MTLDPTLPPSSNFDLDAWKLQLPIDSAGLYDGKFVEQRDLDGYSLADIFFTHPATGAMVLSAPVNGARTTNGHFARCELREWSAGAVNEWKLADGGKLDVTMQVDQVPTLLDGRAAPVVVGQIHSETIATPVRIYYADGSIYWVHGRNEVASADQALAVLDEAAHRPDISLGETFSYTIEVKDDVLVVRVVADGITYQSGVVLNAGWDDDLVYFKAGCYLATDETESSGWGQVSVVGLDVTHDLSAAPELPVSPLPSIEGALSDEGLPRMLKGTGGDDLFLVSASGTVVNAGLGLDTVYALASWTMTNGVERLVLLGSERIGATGRAFADTITGNGAGNLIDGMDGNDVLSGRGGDDRLLGGIGDDAIAGNLGQDLLLGGAGDDSLSGGQGDDIVRGGLGFDKVDGGSGQDVLNGGFGIDRLTGGAGDDTFVIVGRRPAGAIITDFHGSPGDDDRLALMADKLGGFGQVIGEVMAAQFQVLETGDPTGRTARSPEVRFIWEKDDTLLWFDRNGSAPGGLMLLADLQDGASLTSSDLVLI